MSDTPPPGQRPESKMDEKWEKWSASQSSRPAPATSGPEPPKSSKAKGLGCFGIVLLVFLIAWIADEAGCNSGAGGGSSAGAAKPTKAEWRQKIAPYWNPGGGIKVTTIADFKALVGEPSHAQTVEGSAYWYFDCSDGTIQMELIDPNMSGGRLLIKAVNDF